MFIIQAETQLTANKIILATENQKRKQPQIRHAGTKPGGRQMCPTVTHFTVV